MGKHQSHDKQQTDNTVLGFLSQPGVLDLDVGNDEAVQLFLEKLNKIRNIPEVNGLLALQRHLRIAMTLAKNKKLAILPELESLNERINRQAREGIASHQDKRSLVYKLHLANKEPKTIADFLAGCPIDPKAPIGTLLNPRIIERKRDLSFGPPIRTVLADTACRPFANDFVCDEAAGFYIVTDEESVIFFDKDKGEFQVLFWRLTSHRFSAGVVFAELIVLRDVFGEQGTPESTAICEWFQDVIDTAVNERRDVRPKSDGTMVQLGYNAGPRDLRVFQLAKSYTKNLDEQTKADHDTERGLPLDITNKIEDTLEENGLPRIATRNISGFVQSDPGRFATAQISTTSSLRSLGAHTWYLLLRRSERLKSDLGRSHKLPIPAGNGYRIQFRGLAYNFPTFERAPPEAYFTYGYSASYHKDPCYVSGVCGISLNVGRTVNPPPSSTLATPGLRQTRSQTHASSAPGQINSTSGDFSKWPANGGGNFVDMTLKIVVHQAAGTLFAFNPAMGHGTTRLCGATNYLAAITFSSHIFKTFQMAQTGIIEAGDKAGDGNFDYLNVD
ncbi:hypothetical protein R3P38DRAFT_3378644 [Favolaschia claudopus]|uniref:Uncharacterized protein n=1 Tax=Favolaschia claudopus TaxID=2862362 RepID=A0AAV9Z9S1_9AGAR